MKPKAESAIILSPPADAAVIFQMDPFLTKGLMGSKVDQLRLVKNSVSIRYTPKRDEDSRLTKRDLGLYQDIFEKFKTYLQENQTLSLETKNRLEIKYYYYIWKIAKIPTQAKDICVLGCGPGFEIPFIRFLYPESNITAIDYRNSILSDILEASNVRFIQGVVPSCLINLEETFDVVFSNHVMEHMIDPDSAFRECLRILRPGATMIAALPMDGSAQTALHEVLYRELLDERGPSLLNMGIVDLGHPWKTNSSDLYATVTSAGFGDVTVITRSCNYDAKQKVIVDLDEKRRRKGEFLYHITFSPLKYLLNLALGKDHTPNLIQKILICLESKFWFGGNNLKSATAPEALVIGKRIAN